MSLEWVTKHRHMDETDDGRYRVRTYCTESRDMQYRAYSVGMGGSEAILGFYPSKAEAMARCAFHAGPTETHFAPQPVTL